MSFTATANGNALKLTCELLRVFVTESVQRAAAIAEVEGIDRSNGLSDLTSYTKDIVRVLRELKKSTPLASEMLKVLAEENESKSVWAVKDNLFHLLQEIQEHTKAVTSLVITESGDKLYSGSLDRTLKVKHSSTILISMSVSQLSDNKGFVSLKNRSGLLERQQYIVYRCMI
ncbi:hypothetical protein RIF29_19671 [Crotalaria pallida]|uniref:Uncharacterized protein n=1 Tax=Crotalaria pallida TaxID=3830 RepID=A0AAN9I4C6_CROPI